MVGIFPHLSGDKSDCYNPCMYEYFLNIVLLIIAIIFLPLAIAGLSLAPWLPMRKRDLQRIDKIAQLKNNQIFYELGSGDGRVCFFIAKNNPNSQIIGIEVAWPLFLYSKLKLKFSNIKNLQLIHADAFKTDIGDADVVYFYGLTKTFNQKLLPKFKSELRKGCKVISYVFSADNWEVKKGTDRSSVKDHPINYYII